MNTWTETWAFLFLDKNVDLNTDHTSMVYSDGVRMLIYGANTVDEAVEIAKRLTTDENCTLIELCGGFQREGAKRIREATNGKATIGYAIPLDE